MLHVLTFAIISNSFSLESSVNTGTGHVGFHHEILITKVSLYQDLGEWVW